MNQTIDFTEWTDAQLEVGLKFDKDGAVRAEIDRRGGSDDGSKARVAALVKSAKRSPRRAS